MIHRINFQNKEKIEEIISLFKHTFKINRSFKYWTWQFVDNVQGNGWIVYSEEDGEIVGQYAIRRNHINFLGKQIIAGQAVDAMVKKEYRNLGLFEKLSASCFQDAIDTQAQYIFAFPNRKSLAPSIKYMGFCKVCDLQNFEYRIGLKKVITPIFDLLLKLILYIYSFIKLNFKKIITFSKVKIIISDSIPKDIDIMLEEYQRCEVLSIWKDYEYFKWRYMKHVDNKYIFHVLYNGKEIEGIAVCIDRGEEIAICEIIHKFKNINQSTILLLHILHHYSLRKAQKIVFLGHDSGYFNSIFNQAGFKIGSSNFRFIAKDLHNSYLEKNIYFPNNWTITLGDSDVV